MKIVGTTKLFVMNKVATSGIKDPSKTYYKLVVCQDEDAGTISCNEDVYNSVEVNKVNTFVAEYNEKYSTYRIIGILSEKSVKQQ